MNTTSASTISVIIPVRNRETALAECLRSLQTATPAPRDIIVVDDASTDNSAGVAEQHGATVIRLDANHDPNFCRNRGAEEARGDILLFLDSDVVVQPSTLTNVAASFVDPSIDAIVGLYTVHHRNTAVASQYKNLWIRYSYLRSNRTLDWIFGAVAAIRKDVFWKAGGFDRTFFMKYGGEDLELGKRMTNSQHLIKLNPDVEVEHLKHHTLSSLLKNDFERSQGFVRLAGNLGQLGRSITHGFVNVYPNFAYSVPFSWLILACALASTFIPETLWLFVICAMLYLVLNGSFLVYYARHRGIAESIPVLGILFLDHLVCGFGSLKGFIRWMFSRSTPTA
ncbi:MAG TPA: glycosyltransferase [Bacteroidota bacterium]